MLAVPVACTGDGRNLGLRLPCSTPLPPSAWSWIFVVLFVVLLRWGCCWRVTGRVVPPGRCSISGALVPSFAADLYCGLCSPVGRLVLAQLGQRRAVLLILLPGSAIVADGELRCLAMVALDLKTGVFFDFLLRRLLWSIVIFSVLFLI